MIAQLPPGNAPFVETFRDMVAVTVDDEGEQHGFLLTPGAATTVAMRLLAKVDELRGDHAPVLPVTAVAVDHRALDDDEEIARITFTIEGAPLSVFLDLTQFAELAAGLAAASREIDEPRGKR